MTKSARKSKPKSSAKPLTVDIAEMRAEIAELTGLVPTSFSRRYLQNRLSTLRNMSPEDLPHARGRAQDPGDRAVPLSISVSASLRDSLFTEAAKTGVTISALIRSVLERKAGAR